MKKKSFTFFPHSSLSSFRLKNARTLFRVNKLRPPRSTCTFNLILLLLYLLSLSSLPSFGSSYTFSSSSSSSTSSATLPCLLPSSTPLPPPPSLIFFHLFLCPWIEPRDTRKGKSKFKGPLFYPVLIFTVNHFNGYHKINMFSSVFTASCLQPLLCLYLPTCLEGDQTVSGQSS